MKAQLTLMTKKGFYEEAEVEASTLKGVLDKVLPALEAMPTESEGVQQTEWTTLHLVVEK